MNPNKPTPPRQDYEQAYATEVAQVYEEVDAYVGGLECPLLLSMARVLACPVKVNPPNWQHGRVLYAATRRYIDENPAHYYNFVDIGTAKGFSALVLDQASMRSGAPGCIDTIDVIDPYARVRRNSVWECSGQAFTVPDFLREFRKPGGPFLINLHGKGSQEYFANHAPPRIHVAFVDGKHTYDAVRAEAFEIAKRQKRGDLMILDDVQIAPVGIAMRDIESHSFRVISAGFKQIAVGKRL